MKGPRAPAVVLTTTGDPAVALAASDTAWEAFLAPARADPAAVLAFQAEAVAPDTISNVLFSSGTTGTAKAIPWTHVTPMRYACSSTCDNSYVFICFITVASVDRRCVGVCPRVSGSLSRGSRRPPGACACQVFQVLV